MQKIYHDEKVNKEYKKSVSHKLAEDYYDERMKEVTYPDKGEILSTMMKEMETFVGTKKQIEAKEAQIKAAVTTEYRRRQEVYGKNIGNVNAEFRADLEREYGVENNKKKDLLWSKAWELGHSSGLSEVQCFYSDLVELIQE